MKRSMAAIAAAALALGAGLARAQESGWYAGTDVGASRLHVDGVGSNSDTAFGIDGGYRLNRNFAVEAAADRIGRFGSDPSYDVNAYSLAAVGILPLQSGFSLYGKGGYARTHADLGGTTDNANSLLVGAGVMYDISRQYYVKAGWDRYTKVGGADTGSGSADVVGVGLGMRF